MKRRPRLLFVSSRYLLPEDSGGKIRTADILRGLKGNQFDVTLVSPEPRGAAARDAAKLALLCDRFVSWPEPNRSPLFHYLRLRHLASPLPISVATDVSAEGSGVVSREIGCQPDLVVVDFAHTVVLMPEHLAIPSVLFTHNVEAEIFARHLAISKHRLHRWVWRNQLGKMRRFEQRAMQRFTSVVAVSTRDAQQLKDVYGVEAAVIPTGVDLDFFRFEPPSSVSKVPRIVFTASMDSFANIDGIEWFMEAIWPLIAAEEPSAEVTVVGRNPNPRLVSAAKARGLPWRFTGFVEDVRPFVYEASVYIIPLRVGSGTRIKAYEAMALGRPVVSTTIGIEGLQLQPDRHFLLADDPSAFAAAVARLLRDTDLRSRLSHEAYNFVDSHFSASAAARAFESICAETLTRTGEKGYSHQSTSTTTAL